jgi:hypothetical protein
MPVVATFVLALFGNIAVAMPAVMVASAVRLAMLGGPLSVPVGSRLIVVIVG